MSYRKGLVLAGGAGTRLSPLTNVVSKQLLPVYDKPMIYYSIAVLMLANIREMLIITTPSQAPLFKSLLGDGSQWGLSFAYAVQPQPRGVADALLIGENFVGSDRSALILGDNIFYGQGLQKILATVPDDGATIFAYRVSNPQRYGVIELGADNRPLNLVEKPVSPTSPFAVTGLYFFDSHAIDIAKQLKPSPRGELEITDVNRHYLELGQLHVQVFSRGFAWFDTGTYDSLLEASNFVEAIVKRQGLRMCCPEEIAYRKRFISKAEFVGLAEAIKGEYGEYLLGISNERPEES